MAKNKFFCVKYHNTLYGSKIKLLFQRSNHYPRLNESGHFMAKEKNVAKNYIKKGPDGDGPLMLM